MLSILPFSRAFGNRWVWKYPPTRVPPHRPLGCRRVMPTTWGRILLHDSAVAASWTHPRGWEILEKEGLRSGIAGVYRVEHDAAPG